MRYRVARLIMKLTVMQISTDVEVSPHLFISGTPNLSDLEWHDFHAEDQCSIIIINLALVHSPITC